MWLTSLDVGDGASRCVFARSVPHIDPDKAKCDGPSALPMHRLGERLAQAKRVDDPVKSFAKIEID